MGSNGAGWGTTEQGGGDGSHETVKNALPKSSEKAGLEVSFAVKNYRWE